MLKLPTISEMPRAAVCDASVVLERIPFEPPSPAALRGTRIHAWIAAQLRGWPMPDIGRTKVEHIDMVALRAYLGDGDIKCEAAFSFDGEVATFLGENIGRNYPAGMLCGAADIMVGLKVVDIKTGSFPVPSPVDNWQLSTLAALSGCTTGVITTLARDGSWTFDPHTWSVADLAAIRERLRGMMSRWRDAHEMDASGWGVTRTPNRECIFCKSICEHARQRTEVAA